MVQVTDKPTRTWKMPWDIPNERLANGPWHLQQWCVSTEAGHFVMLCNNIKNDKGTWVREGEFIDKLRGFSAQHILERTDLDRIYRISATKGIPLLEAMVEHVGKEQFSPSYIDAIHAAPKRYADPKYGPAVAPTTDNDFASYEEEPPPKPTYMVEAEEKAKAAKKKKSKKKASKKQNIGDALLERQAAEKE